MGTGAFCHLSVEVEPAGECGCYSVGPAVVSEIEVVAAGCEVVAGMGAVPRFETRGRRCIHR